VALFLEDGVVGDRDLSIGFRGNAGGEAGFSEGCAQPIGVVGFVGEKLPGLGQGGAGSISAAPLSSLICSSLNSMTSE
jgi:hypothetical protein